MTKTIFNQELSDVVNQAIKLTQEGNEEHAKNICLEIIKSNDYKQEDYWYIGELLSLYMKKEDLDNAIKAFDKSLAKEGDIIQVRKVVHGQLGRCYKKIAEGYLDNGDKKNANKYYELAKKNLGEACTGITEIHNGTIALLNLLEVALDSEDMILADDIVNNKILNPKIMKHISDLGYSKNSGRLVARYIKESNAVPVSMLKKDK